MDGYVVSNVIIEATHRVWICPGIFSRFVSGFFLDFLSWNWQVRSPLVLLGLTPFAPALQHPRHSFNSVASFSTSSASRVGFIRLGLGWVQGWLGLVQGGLQAYLGKVWGRLRFQKWDGSVLVYGGLLGVGLGGFGSGLGWV